jgi:transglutaminase-like putative cysteine protease
MLTVGLPADVTGDLLITPVLVTFVAALASTTLALRTKAILAPAGPTLLALVIGLLFTADRPAAGLPVTAAYLLATLLLVIVRVTRLERAQALALDLAPGSPEPRRRTRVIGRIAFGLPVALVVAALGVTGAWFVPVASGTARFDPRTVAPQEFQVDDTISPLAKVKSQLDGPSQTLFTVQVTGGTVDRVRTAALDTYDGALWTSNDTFLVAGHQLPADPDLSRPNLVHARISIQSLDGPYLPVVGWPVQVGATGLGFSGRSGVLVTHGPDVHGLTYDMVGAVAPDDAGLRSAVPNLSDDRTRDTQLPPGLPAELDAKAKDLTTQGSTPYTKLMAIRDYLRTLPYSLDARPGHSYDALRRLFGSNPQDRIGYAEQYAAAFAVLARDQGFPTRVAVGYLLRPQAQHGDTYTVTTADAHAWAEVDMTGYGWVTFDPTNFNVRRDPGQQDKNPPVDSPKNPRDQNPGDPGDASVNPNLRAGPGTVARIVTGSVIGLIALGGLAVLLVIAVLLAKFVRRRRHRSGTAAQRVIGAWRDSADRLVERGIPVPHSLTAIEAARHARDHLGEPAGAVAVLAPIVTQAMYFPGDPPPDVVREAWELNAQFRRDLRRSRGVLRALRAWFDPRPLVYGWRDRRALRRALKELQKG